jgi:hypothetical protein
MSGLYSVYARHNALGLLDIKLAVTAQATQCSAAHAGGCLTLCHTAPLVLEFLPLYYVCILSLTHRFIGSPGHTPICHVYRTAMQSGPSEIQGVYSMALPVAYSTVGWHTRGSCGSNTTQPML